MIRSENDVWIPITLEDVLVHSLISRLAAAIATLGIDNDLPGAFAGREIIMNGSTVEFERAVDGVKNVIQHELDAGLGRVQFEDRVLSK